MSLESVFKLITFTGIPRYIHICTYTSMHRGIYQLILNREKKTKVVKPPIKFYGLKL